MKFRCQECNAQYQIADEKLGKKGVRVRCKKCGEVITVLPEESAEEEDKQDPFADGSDSTAHDRDEELENQEENQEEGQEEQDEDQKAEDLIKDALKNLFKD